MPEPTDLDRHRQQREARKQLEQATRELMTNLVAMSQAHQILNDGKAGDTERSTEEESERVEHI